MKTIQDYEAQGYVGTDGSLEISLFEYGLIWKEEETYFHFVYGVGVKNYDHETLYNTFDWANVDKNEDVYKEYDWAEFDKVFDCKGITKETFDNATIPWKIHALLSYYGTDEIFGTAYYPFKIIDLNNEEDDTTNED